MEFETLAIHAGQEPDPNNGAVMTPIYQTSTYIQDGVGRAETGIRVLANEESDAAGAGELPGGARRQRPLGWHLRPEWRRRMRSCACSTAAPTWLPATTYMVAPSGCSTRSCAGTA